VRDPENAPISEKLKALLALARRVQQGGRSVGSDDIARARRAGATDIEIHDTVLIAAAFCMFNRYVDGLDAPTPKDPASYRGRAQMVADHGYSASLPPK
jgi:alkylhydroperoxidase family enzyme